MVLPASSSVLRQALVLHSWWKLKSLKVHDFHKSPELKYKAKSCFEIIHIILTSCWFSFNRVWLSTILSPMWLKNSKFVANFNHLLSTGCCRSRLRHSRKSFSPWLKIPSCQGLIPSYETTFSDSIDQYHVISNNYQLKINAMIEILTSNSCWETCPRLSLSSSRTWPHWGLVLAQANTRA